MTGGAGPVERLVRHDRRIVMLAVLVIVVIAAAYTVLGVGMEMSALEMTRMARAIGAPMEMGGATAWDARHALLIFLMWWVMMIAMMTPSAAPLLLLYTAVKRRGPDGARATALSLVLLFGYLLTWAGFSALATALQWALERADLVAAAMMTVKSGLLAGAILLVAGLYQFTPFKAACLKHCRAPAHFIAAHGRPGFWGALRLGGHHGAYCLGCCWALMALLFVGGVMNLWWIVALALYVLAEKMLAQALWLTWITGGALIAAGVWLMAVAVY